MRIHLTVCVCLLTLFVTAKAQQTKRRIQNDQLYMHPLKPPVTAPDVTTWQRQDEEEYVQDVLPEDDPTGRCAIARVIKLGKTTWYLSPQGEMAEVTSIVYGQRDFTFIAWERNQDAKNVWWIALRTDSGKEIIGRSIRWEPLFSSSCAVEGFLLHLNKRPFDKIPLYTIQLK